MQILTYDEQNANNIYTVVDIAQLLNITRDAAVKRIKRWMIKNGLKTKRTEWNANWTLFSLTRKEVCDLINHK